MVAMNIIMDFGRRKTHKVFIPIIYSYILEIISPEKLYVMSEPAQLFIDITSILVYHYRFGFDVISPQRKYVCHIRESSYFGEKRVSSNLEYAKKIGKIIK